MHTIVVSNCLEPVREEQKWKGKNSSLLLYWYISSKKGNLVVLLYYYLLAAPHLTFRNRNTAKKLHLSEQPRHKASTTVADPGRVGRVDQAEESPENRAPRGGPQLELSRRQLTTLFKSKPSAALVPRPTYLNRSLRPLSSQGTHIFTCTYSNWVAR